MARLLAVLFIAYAAAATDAAAEGSVTCTSSFTGDTNVEACSAFCSAAQAASHCKRCKVRAREQR